MKATKHVGDYVGGVFNVRDRLNKVKKLPPLASLKGYELGDVPHDIVAGLIIAALSIPISMGYAQIAGLSPVYGLYASILPAIVFALTTNTRSIVFGLDSAAVAVTGGVVTGMGVTLGSEQAFALMPMLTALVALILLVFAFTRAGKLVHYVPEPVMNGFILGISITIIVHQAPKLLGVTGFDFSSLLDNAAFLESPAPVAFATFSSLATEINIPTVALSVFSLSALFFIGSYAPKLPGALIVLAFGMLFSVSFGLESQGVAVLGDMPEGFPSLVFPQVTGLGAAVMIGGAFSIAITIAIESLLTLNTFSMQEGERPHGDRELVSLALGNVASSFIGCPPCSASLSRTAAAKASGGTSQMASIVGALTILAFVLVLAPHLRHLPQPVLASIVVYAMVQVVDFGAVRRYAKYVRIELAVLALVAFVVVALGAIAGVVVGIVVSLLTQLYRTKATGNQKLVGFKGGIGHSGAKPEVPKNMHVCYLHGFLSFSNIDRTLESVRKGIVDGVDTVILEISGVTNLDATATETLRRFIRSLRDQGVSMRVVRSLALANDHYTRYELRRLMKRVNIYPTVQSAIDDVNRMKRKQMLDIPLGEAENLEPESIRAEEAEAQDVESGDAEAERAEKRTSDDAHQEA